MTISIMTIKSMAHSKRILSIIIMTNVTLSITDVQHNSVLLTLFIVMPRVLMLDVAMLGVVMLGVTM